MTKGATRMRVKQTRLNSEGKVYCNPWHESTMLRAIDLSFLKSRVDLDSGQAGF